MTACEQLLQRLARMSLPESGEDDEVNQEVLRADPTQGCSVSSYVSLHHNWQSTCTTVRERNAAMFNNELMADVHFLIGQGQNVQRIPAHKYILATGSSVFFAMFYGGLANSNEEIEIPDVEITAFLNLLKYLYYDEIELEADTVISTLYVAKKYIVPHLAKCCVHYLETSLNARNACILLSQSRLFEEHELTQRCWEVIDAQADEALRSESFVDVDYATLEQILARETISARELSLFKAAERWAEAECRRRDMDSAQQSNRRLVLQDALYHVRIPTMPLEEFANTVAQSGLLTLQETNSIFLYHTAAHRPELRFGTEQRTGLVARRCQRFQATEHRGNQWRYRGRCDSIQFCVDKRIFLVGYGLYGSSGGPAEYQAKIELKKGSLPIVTCHRKMHSDGTSNTFSVYFDNPVLVEPDVYYTASVVLDGAQLSYFGQEGMLTVTSHGVTFQFQCSTDSTNGTGIQGGQIPELIFYTPWSLQ